MSLIPHTFANEVESYITIPALKRFAKEKRNEDLKTTVDRPLLIQEIEDYADQSPEKKEIVLDWLDHVLAEGIKDVQIHCFQDIDEQLRDDGLVKRILDSQVADPTNTHLNKGYAKELKLFRYDIIQNSSYGRKIVLYMGKLLCFYDKKHDSSKIPYPILVEVYLDKGIIVARAKSKSNIYQYMEEFILESAKSTNAEKEMEKALTWACEKLSIRLLSKDEAENFLKRCLYWMLDRYTQTPEEIKQLMEDKADVTEKAVNLLMEDICGLSERYREDVKSGMLNMVEKYFSISYLDKMIFTKDRDAYPLKLSATDEEDSKVEQTAALEEPLQSKAIFFDNKKMLQKSQTCEGVTFVFNRLDSTYCSKQFKVKIDIRKSKCTLKFTEFTMEEDILHVLFSLINSTGNIDSGTN